MARTMQDRARAMGTIHGGTSQNAAFHKRANLKGAGGSPKSTDMGKDMSRDATNVLGGTKVSERPISPSANSQSRNGA